MKVCIFIRYLESNTSLVSAYFGLDKRECECIEYSVEIRLFCDQKPFLFVPVGSILPIKHGVHIPSDHRTPRNLGRARIRKVQLASLEEYLRLVHRSTTILRRHILKFKRIDK
jgi:hypothetical protein